MLKYMIRKKNVFWFRRRVAKIGEVVFSLKTKNYDWACVLHTQINSYIQNMIYKGIFKKMTKSEIKAIINEYKVSVLDNEYSEFLETRDNELSIYDNGEFYGGHTSKALEIAVNRYTQIYESNNIERIQLETAKILQRSNLNETLKKLGSEEELRTFHWELFKTEWKSLKAAYHEQQEIEDESTVSSTHTSTISINDTSLIDTYSLDVVNQLKEMMGTPQTKIKISELITMYIDENKMAKDWGDKNERDLEYIFKHFSSWYKDKNIDELNRKDFSSFRDKVILNLPVSAQKNIFRDKSTYEILKIVSENKLQTIGISTQNKHIKRIHQVFEWATRCDYLPKNLTKELAITDKNQSKKQKTKKVPYSDKELIKIFEKSPWFTNELRIKLKYNPEHIFIPLLALYTGAKPTELATLKVDAIKKQDSIYGIDFNQKIKTADSERFTPLAQDILDLGFLKYIKYLKRKKSVLLFPNLKIYKSGGTQFTNDFSKFNRENISQEKNKTFYSLRHLVNQKLKNNKIQIYTINAIIGHSDRTGNKDIDTYGDYKMRPIDLQEAINNSLIYNLDFSHIQKEINEIYS